MTIKDNYIRILTLILLVISLLYLTLRSEVLPKHIVFMCLIILCQILHHFPAKLNYPGKVTDQNKERLYRSARSFLVYTSFILSIIMLVSAFQFYTKSMNYILAGLLLFITVKTTIAICFYVD